MSLINQALRKAQNQRTPSRPATAADQSRNKQQNYNHQQSNSKPALIIGLIIGIAVLIGLVAGLTVIVLRSQPATATQPVEAPAPAIARTPSSQAELRPLAPEPTIAARPQTLDPTNSSVLDELRFAREAAEAKIAAEALAAQKAEADAIAAKKIADAQPSQDIIDWLSKAKVTGVRISDTDSKVIFNNKAYSAGDTVNVSLGLKILIIQEHRLLFVDPNGKKYMKQL